MWVRRANRPFGLAFRRHALCPSDVSPSIRLLKLRFLVSHVLVSLRFQQGNHVPHAVTDVCEIFFVLVHVA